MKRLIHPIGFLIILGIISACKPAAATAMDPTSSAASPTATALPTPTPTPERQKLIYLAPGDADVEIRTRVLSALEPLVAAQDWEILTTEEFAPGLLDTNVKALIALPSASDITAIAGEHLDIQFVAIGYPSLDPTPNLSVLGGGFAESRPAFVAGYMAAVVTADWRVGILSSPSSVSLPEVETGFDNGVAFYCGLCRQTYPPYYNYPIVVRLDQDHSPASWQAAADELIAKGVRTLYINAEGSNAEALGRLAQNGTIFIGSGTDLQEFSQNWVGMIRWAPEQILQDYWDQIVEGKGGWKAEIPLVLDSINQNLVSPGRRELVESVMDELYQGYIDPNPVN